MTSSTAKLIASSTILHTSDFAGSLKYYCDVLGFTVKWSSDEYSFAIIERDGVEFHLSGAVDDADNVRMEKRENALYDIYIYSDNVDVLYEEFQEKGAECIYAPQDQPYGMRELGIRDINGYKISFGQDLSDQAETGPLSSG